MKAEEIRKQFLDFFESKGHKIVPSAPIVVKNDPTLMFTNAGMNQFKDIFLGNKPAADKRVADTQKCLRVSGKHNDLEEVGIDTYHHTMFEMLGNWSFGDYFKKEAITWAWELLTEVYKIPKDKLYVTVFEGYKEENLAFDHESYDTWKKFIAEDRIINGNKKDNFWEMGDTGPCGPCSEIHVDIRPENEKNGIDGKSLVNQGHPQVIEIWNNVFMEFNRKVDGSLEKLPAQHVDTGMGFERLCMVLQGKTSNYDTDVFQPVIKMLETDFKIPYKKDEKTDIAMRVIADHIRAITFTIADGQLPSNTGAGYVIRRILRRAVRYGYTFLGMNEPYIYKLVTVLAHQFKNVFPEVIKQEDFIKRVVHEEEKAFLRTLGNGINEITSIFNYIKQADKFDYMPEDYDHSKLNYDYVKFMETRPDYIITGKNAFKLYDTYGFPIDLTILIASENGFEVDLKAFEELLDEQRKRSRADAVKESGDWVIIDENDIPTDFKGYDSLEELVYILRYRKTSQKGETAYHLVLDKTPFYAESGGQVGDIGKLVNGTHTIQVTNTFKENNLIIHEVKKLPSTIEDLKEPFRAIVDAKKRIDTENNHSCTHLLQAALRKVLGTHVEQKGSLVNEKILRFDFSHFAKMTEEEIAKVEHIVNEKIREDIHLDEKRNVPFNEAVKHGAMALFGEKYGEFVRVITFDENYSVELCGGTHVAATGKIGFFKIISESAIAAGVRRIEAVTGTEAENYINNQIKLLDKIKESLKNPKDVLNSIENLKEENKALQNALEKLQNEKVLQVRDALLKETENIADAISIIAKQIYIDNTDSVKNLVFELKNQLPGTIVLLGAGEGDKANLWLAIPEDLVKKHNLNAGNLIREIAKEIDGGGGGQAFYATAGGKNPSKLNKAIEKGRGMIVEILSNIEIIDMEDIKSKFQIELLETCKEATKLGYKPSYFLRMIDDYGAHEAARNLIHNNKIHEGFMKLYDLKRLDLSVERSALKEEFSQLFTNKEKEICIKRLKDYGFEFNS